MSAHHHRVPYPEMTAPRVPEEPPAVYLKRNGPLLQMADDLGGEAIVDMARQVPLIVNWHAVPFDKRFSAEEPGLKRRGFSRTILGALAQMGVTQFCIPLQSVESQKAMARLIETGAVVAVPGYVAGPSDSEHPTRFRLCPSQTRRVRLVGTPGPALDSALLRGSAQLPRPSPASSAPCVSAPVMG